MGLSQRRTMYGLSLTASLDWASDTRFFASATRRARSSDTLAGVPDSDFEGGVTPGVCFGVEPGVEDGGDHPDGIATLAGTGFVGVGAAIPCAFCVAGPAG